jgi:hypothetical protein
MSTAEDAIRIDFDDGARAIGLIAPRRTGQLADLVLFEAVAKPGHAARIIARYRRYYGPNVECNE